MVEDPEHLLRPSLGEAVVEGGNPIEAKDGKKEDDRRGDVPPMALLHAAEDQERAAHEGEEDPERVGNAIGGFLSPGVGRKDDLIY